MAMHKSAKKRIRSNARRQERNKARVSDTRSAIRKVEEAVKSGDAKAAAAALKEAQPKLARTAGKGIMHKKTAARKISRLAAKVKKVSGK